MKASKLRDMSREDLIAEANTTYGMIGIKVWIYKGEVFEMQRPEKGR